MTFQNRSFSGQVPGLGNSGFGKLNLTILVLLTLCFLGLVATMFINQKVHQQHIPIVRSIAQVETNLALGHLWFEEILSGDRQESLEQVEDLWDQATQTVLTILHGGQGEFGSLKATEDEDIIAQLEGQLLQMEQFRSVAKGRFADSRQSIAGSPSDQEFDRVFYLLFDHTERVEQQILARIESQENRFRKLQWLGFGANLLMAALLFTSFRVNEKRRARANAKLAASELRFRKMFEMSAEGILVAEISTTKFLYANPSICRMLGFSASDIVGMKAKDLHPTSVHQKVAESFSRLPEEDVLVLTEFPCLHKKGHVVMATIQSSLMEIEGQQLALGLLTDKTQEVSDREEKARLQGQLLQAQKMEAVGNLAGGVAHDFNNLLQAILGYSDLLMESGLDATRQKDVENIRQAASRAGDLTRQLLAFSRRQVISPTDLDLNGSIEEIFQMLKSLLGENIHLEFLKGSKIGTVSLDKAQLEQVLMNLCLNARDAMGSAGSLIIETENVRINEEYSHNNDWAVPGRYVLLSISDTGSGMSPETLKQVFEPFFTTKEVGKGTGLGLSTVYGIVKQNQGLVHAYSELGKGSTFKVYFPLVERPAAEVGRKIEDRIVGGNEGILVAEDDVGVRRYVVRMLGDAGYDVTAVENGQEAVDIFERNPEKFDLALLDVVMPEMGGKEAQEAMQVIRPDLKVIFASGYSQNAIHTDFVLDEGRILIEKPYAREDLLRKVRSVLDE